jgi:toxin ParE1/3/4
MARYKLTNEAVKDLEENWVYTCPNWSVEQADRYYNLIIDEIEFLSSNPLSGRSYLLYKTFGKCSTIS